MHKVEILGFVEFNKYFWSLKLIRPVPVAARSKARVCGRSPAEIVGSNPTGGALMSVCCECCLVEESATGCVVVCYL